jgi:hypothetical protein
MNNDMTRVTFVLLILMLMGCDNIEKKYFPNGQVRFEVPVKDGKWHGRARGYYESGKLRGEVEYVEGKEEGLWTEFDEMGNLLERRNYSNGVLMEQSVYSDGVLVGETIYDSLGRPWDVRQYNKNGERDSTFMSVILYTVPDTIRMGEEASLFVRLANADSTKISAGYLLIASRFDSLKNNIPADTLANIYSTNDVGFKYRFKRLQKGESEIHGSLRFVDKTGVTINAPTRFIYQFQVR